MSSPLLPAKIRNILEKSKSAFSAPSPVTYI